MAHSGRILGDLPTSAPRMSELLRDKLQSALGSGFTLDRELGGGGMSRVFLADDAALGRRVVVKVLAPELAEGLSAERFAREVRLAARLQHPNVVPVIAAGTGPDGLPYYLMPFIDGRSLRERLAAGPLPITEAVTVLRDMARALAYAHSQGVVHRDIKPENVLLTGGAAVVADFGIAKALSAAAGAGTKLTQFGMAVGTPAYIAPEQAAGDDVDHRADLYAWGLVAWEALAGRHPFADRTSPMALIGAQLTQTPVSIATVRSDVPAALAAVVTSCLAKDPSARPANAGEVLQAIDAIAITPSAPLPRTSPVVVATTARGASPSIAVLPFANMSADAEAEYFSDGITEEILNALAKLSGLRVMARTSSFAFKGRNLDVRTVGEQLGARYVLEGSVRRAGPRMRVTAQLIDAAEGHHLWSERYDRDVSDVFAVQDEITAAIRDALSERLLGIGPARHQKTPSIDAATYELYLRGLHLIRQRLGEAERGITIMEDVIRRAPEYAPAYATLAVARMLRVYYGFVSPREGWPAVRELAERAAALDPLHGPAHFLLAEVAFHFEWDWAKAEALYRRGIEVDANDVEAPAGYSLYLAAMGRFDDALRSCARACALDPLNPAVLVRAMIVQYLARRYDQALVRCERVMALWPDFPESYRWAGKSLMAMGRIDDAVARLETAVHLSGRHVWSVMDLGLALLAGGRVDEARRLGDELVARSTVATLPAFARTLAALCQSPPDLDGVFGQLNAWIDERGFWLVMLAVEVGR
jgi:eukaryotic-like serine/threonine-protein kinase